MQFSVLKIYWIIGLSLFMWSECFGQERRYDKSMVAFSHDFLPVEENIQEFLKKEYETIRIDFVFEEKIPKEFWNLKSNNVLHIFHYRMKELPPEIGKMDKIKSLTITTRGLVSLPHEIGKLTNLETLSITTSADTFYIPKSVKKLKNLKRLFITLGDTELKGHFFSSDSLKILKLSCKGIIPLPPDIYTFSNLENLKLEGSFNAVTKEIGNLKNLTNLFIAAKMIPDSTSSLNIFDFPRLKKLFLWLPTPELVPDSIINLNSLVDLSIKISGLQHLPKGLSNCKELKKLFIGSNKKIELSDELSNLSRLESLSLNLYDCKKFPEINFTSQSLKGFFITGNLKSPPSSVSLSRFPNLETVSFISCVVDINHLSNCKKLKLTHAGLTKIDNTFLNFKNLRKLNLSANSIEDIPPFIKDLKFLSKLELRHNRIKNIPPYVNNFPPSLEIDLTFNPELTKTQPNISTFKQKITY